MESHKTGESRRRFRFTEFETQIAQLDKKLVDLSLQLGSPPLDSQLVQDLGEDYMQIQSEIYALLAEREQLQG